MTHTCLNLACDTECAVIGVCVRCANSDYKPKRDGIDIDGYRIESEREIFKENQARSYSGRGRRSR